MTISLTFGLDKAAIAAQLNALEKHRVQSTIHSTILSVNYENEAITRWRNNPEEATQEEKLKAYSRGYATRVQPALLVKPELLTNLDPKKLDWDDYANKSFDKSVADEFFNNKNLIEWGAPTTAVISGALLYMRDGVVLDVPPFSNFSLNVVWIDDQLRYALHRELGDFARTTIRRSGRYLHVRSDTPVIKCRAGFDKLANYTLCTYLPQLLWGAVVDAWICEEPILKLRQTEAKTLGKEKEWHDKKGEDSRGSLRGILAERIKQAQAGRAIRDVANLREELRTVALRRIEEVRKIWGNLRTDDGIETFASCWVKRRVPQVLQSLIEDQIDRDAEMKPNEKDIAKEIARELPENIVVGSALGNQLERLITDAVGYLRWVQRRPHVVQVVRSVKRGTLPSDLL